VNESPERQALRARIQQLLDAAERGQDGGRIWKQICALDDDVGEADKYWLYDQQQNAMRSLGLSDDTAEMLHRIDAYGLAHNGVEGGKPVGYFGRFAMSFIGGGAFESRAEALAFLALGHGESACTWGQSGLNPDHVWCALPPGYERDIIAGIAAMDAHLRQIGFLAPVVIETSHPATTRKT
jgi:hypothetical protein